MKPILMVWADAPAAASASPDAATSATQFLDFIVLPPLCIVRNLLPGAIVDRVLEGRPRLHQPPPQGPLVGVVEALAGIGLGRRVEDARNLEVFALEQPTRFLDEVARMLAGVLVDRIGRAGFGPEHGGERGAVELVPRRFAAR